MAGNVGLGLKIRKRLRKEIAAKVRKELRTWRRRLHDEVHATTVFVTHDQDEALEVADQIVVINDGRIEQVGTPDELYDAPASEFVMSFLGPVTTLDGQLVRPHDIEIEPAPFPDAHVGTVAALNRVGFEVRLDVTLDADPTHPVHTHPVHTTSPGRGGREASGCRRSGLAAPGGRSVHHRAVRRRADRRRGLAAPGRLSDTGPDPRWPSPGQSGPPPSDISSPALGGREILVRR